MLERRVMETNPGVPPSDKIQFVVLDEDKLCLLYPGRPWSVDVLATKASAMRPNLSLTYPRPHNPERYRLAARQDFEDFRVLLSQWPEDEFEIPVCPENTHPEGPA